ncbi:MAG: HEAT repeat domain-containing protein [Bdellovibrionota bacterium]
MRTGDTLRGGGAARQGGAFAQDSRGVSSPAAMRPVLPKMRFAVLLSLALWLGAFPFRAGAQSLPGQEETVRRAIGMLAETYARAPQSEEEAQRFSVLQGRALDDIADAGPAARGILREALQQEGVLPPVAYTLATLLVLSEGKGAADFVLRATARLSPAISPAEAYYFAHTLSVAAPKQGAELAFRFAKLPENTEFPVPAANLVLPLVPAMAYLLAAGDNESLNELGRKLSKPGKLHFQNARTLLRVAAHLQAVELVPGLLRELPKLPANSPVLEDVLDTLGRLADLSALKPLSDYARKGKTPKVRERAALALADLRSPMCEDALLAALGDPVPAVRSAAIVGLAAIETPGSLDALRKGLGGLEKSEQVRQDYLQAAELVGDRSWAPDLDRASRKWVGVQERVKQIEKKAARRETLPERIAPELWPELPLNRLDPKKLDGILMEMIERGGIDFPVQKKTILYSAVPEQIPALTPLRILLAQRLTRENILAWTEYLETLRLLRIRLRPDPRPLFPQLGKAPHSPLEIKDAK